MVEIVIYSKKDCCLCEVAKEIIYQVLEDNLFKKVNLKEIDITFNEELKKKYESDIPLVLINGKFAFRYKVHPVTLKNKLLKLISPGQGDD